MTKDAEYDPEQLRLATAFAKSLKLTPDEGTHLLMILRSTYRRPDPPSERVGEALDTLARAVDDCYVAIRPDI